MNLSLTYLKVYGITSITMLTILVDSSISTSRYLHAERFISLIAYFVIKLIIKIISD